MKIDIRYIYGAMFGMIFSSLLIALRYENDKLARETLLFLQHGINPFWSLLFMNILLFLIIPLLFTLGCKLIKIRKRTQK